MKYVSYKDRKAVASDLKKIYQSAAAEEAERELSAFEQIWEEKFPSIGKSWRKHLDNLITLFHYAKEVRKRHSQKSSQRVSPPPPLFKASATPVVGAFLFIARLAFMLV